MLASSEEQERYFLFSKHRLTNVATMSNQETLIFLHIPKTAGTTLSIALANWFQPDELYHIRSGNHDGAPQFSPNFGPEETFCSLPTAERARFRCVLGHTKFGLHKAIPGPAKYFTMLRNPLDRYVSQVAQYNRMVKRGEIESQSRQVTLNEYRKIKPVYFRNPQTRWISGIRGAAFWSREESEVLALAKHHLAEWFSVVGVVEQIEQSMALLAAYCDKPVPVIDRENVSSVRPSIDEFTAAQLDEFKANNRLDEELWQYVRQGLQSHNTASFQPGKLALRQRLLKPFKKIARKLKAA